MSSRDLEITFPNIVIFLVLAVVFSGVIAAVFNIVHTSLTNFYTAWERLNVTVSNPYVNLVPVYEMCKSAVLFFTSLLSRRDIVLILLGIGLVLAVVYYGKLSGWW